MLNLTSEDVRTTHKQAGRKLEYFTIVWTTIEAAIGITTGLLAGSVALIGFGVDSVIEIASGTILLWRLSDHQQAEEREEIAHRLVGIAFFALAAYILLNAGHDLIAHDPPRVSYLGIAYAGACIIVMPLLARAKRRVARHLDSHALHADSHQSDICTYLSVILIVGLALNALLGWWWADPLAALCMVPIVIREGISGLRNESCSHHHDA